MPGIREANMVLPACRRHLQCPFGMLLTQNLVHIATIVGMTCGRLIRGGLVGNRCIGNRIGGIAAHQFDELTHMPHAHYIQSIHHRSLVKIAMGNNHFAHATFLGMQHDREQPMNRQHRAVKIHFAEHNGIF